MVGLLLATKQKRGSHIAPSNSFTSGYWIRLSLDLFWLIDNTGTHDFTHGETHQGKRRTREGTYRKFTRKYAMERAV